MYATIMPRKRRLKQHEVKSKPTPYEAAGIDWNEVLFFIRQDLAENAKLRDEFIVWYKKRQEEWKKYEETA